MNSEFWVPKHKWQLVNWLNARAGNKGWQRFNARRLYAIYFKMRRSGVTLI